MHRLDARVKLLGFFMLLVVAITTPPDRFGAFAGYVILLMAVAAVSRIPLPHLARRMSVALPVVVVASAIIPFLHRGAGDHDVVFHAAFLNVSRAGLLLAWNGLAKGFIGILCAVLLGYTTPFPELLRGLERLRAPRSAVMLVGFTYRYLFVLVDEGLRMKRARDGRCYGGKWLWHARVIGQMIGTLFLRAHDRAERVYLAMLSRGFSGELPGTAGKSLGGRDYAFLLGLVGAALVLRAAMP